MAMDRLQPQEPVGAEKPSDLDKVIASVKEHPLLYVSGILLIIAVGLGYMFYSTSAEARAQAEATQLVRAATEDEPEQRIPLLDAVAAESTALTPEAIYLKGETAFGLNDFETAQAAFERIVNEFPEFQFAPDALEGLGYIEETKGNYDEAIVHYLDVQVRYPGTYAARRQHYNLGRAYEAQGNYQEAINAFRRQIGEFPDSVVSGRAQHELHQYQASHPELFQQFEEELTPAPGAESAPEMEMVVVPEAEELEAEPGVEAEPAPEPAPVDEPAAEAQPDAPVSPVTEAEQPETPQQ